METVEAHKLTPDERRNHILDIAYEAFLRDGYSGTSMSRIAARLGGSKTTLYNYFASKKDLFVAVADRESVRLFDQIFAVGETAGDFRALIVQLAHSFLTAMLSDHLVAAYRLIVAESGRFPEVGQMTHDTAMRSGLLRLAAYFQRAMDAGDMRNANAQLAAEQFLDLASGYLHKQRLWNVISEVSADVIAKEADNIANTFLAAFGNDAWSSAARRIG